MDGGEKSEVGGQHALAEGGEVALNCDGLR
jgi:hypothetical protein